MNNKDKDHKAGTMLVEDMGNSGMGIGVAGRVVGSGRQTLTGQVCYHAAGKGCMARTPVYSSRSRMHILYLLHVFRNIQSYRHS